MRRERGRRMEHTGEERRETEVGRGFTCPYSGSDATDERQHQQHNKEKNDLKTEKRKGGKVATTTERGNGHTMRQCQREWGGTYLPVCDPVHVGSLQRSGGAVLQ